MDKKKIYKKLILELIERIGEEEKLKFIYSFIKNLIK